jgi:hypothetical protein
MYLISYNIKLVNVKHGPELWLPGGTEIVVGQSVEARL